MEIDSGTLSGDPYDLIIIGSGPAGLTLARKYTELATGKILVVESGHRSNSDSDAQKLNVVEASGDLTASDYLLHNQRVFGGTSSVWSGFCAVLEKRSFLNREWPFAYDELYKWYPEAARILNLPVEAHTVPEKPFADNRNIIYKPYYLNRPVTRFADLFGDWLIQSADVNVLFNHTVTNVTIQNGAVSSVFIRKSSDSKKAPMELFGRRIVLAAGGIQNARLLQLSLPGNNKLPTGRYFCEHPHLYSYVTIVLDREKFQQQIAHMPSKPLVHGIALSSEFSKTHRLVSATFDIDIRESRSRSDLSMNLLGRKREVIVAKSHCRAEMNSDARNRVTLSDSRKDHMGQPIAHVTLRVDRQETLAVCKQLNSQLIRSGLGRMEAPRTVKIYGGGHMMGTTRMGNDPALSVTDAQGQVHGVKNLYVAGSSLFPAAAAANPTFTIVALSLRLAAHLAGRGA